MQHLPIWYLGKVESGSCSKLVDEIDLLQPTDASMGIAGESLNKTYRNTKVNFAPFGHWFSNELYNYAVKANTDCKWDYLLSGREAIQFAQYEKDQHYNWHIDTFLLSQASLDRKISVVCLLNDDFEGGNLQLRLYNEYTPKMEKGSIIAFPSLIEHRVTPVTKGKRYSATMWISGPKFR
jgi:hypothetical protein